MALTVELGSGQSFAAWDEVVAITEVWPLDAHAQLSYMYYNHVVCWSHKHDSLNEEKGRQVTTRFLEIKK